MVSIGEVSKRTGISTHTLRFHEKEGLFFDPIRICYEPVGSGSGALGGEGLTLVAGGGYVMWSSLVQPVHFHHARAVSGRRLAESRSWEPHWFCRLPTPDRSPSSPLLVPR
ncbi:MerR family DNA-binding transcriptional regulator [Streptantibioticus ferralitis]|uniref:MerR family DNA-binding transcriptional regulator n=1 Tax=Streptantibioticus ferralitis TaxID=236510 RepID=A0ABT5Z129_9ACTN|nr:MerR family DNA-binding transcriptional regulator [Streptantibioticus ferralitis]MDF2257543.1 MerR family DNA-binding transcriptional regulator [Streptantibioticus ferralitis]